MPAQSGKLIATKSSNDKKIIVSAKTVVTAINPDLHAVSPRPGGIVKILPSLSQTNVKDVINLESKSLAHNKRYIAVNHFLFNIITNELRLLIVTLRHLYIIQHQERDALI